MKNDVTVLTAYYATGQWLSSPKTYQAHFDVQDNQLSFSGNADVSSNCYMTIFRAQPNVLDLDPSSSPSKIDIVHWLQAPIPQKLQYRLRTITNNSGKFLVFVPTKMVDKMWTLFKTAYEEGKLGYGLQCSTACPSPTAKEEDRNVNSLIVVYVQDSFDLKGLGKIAATIIALLGEQETILRYITDRGTRKRDFSLIPYDQRAEKYRKRYEKGDEKVFLYTFPSKSQAQNDFAVRFESENREVAERRITLLQMRDLKKFPMFSENVLLKIFSHLGLKDIVRAGQVCKGWNHVAEHDSLWQLFLEKVSNRSVDEKYVSGSKKEFITKNILIERSYLSWKKFPSLSRRFVGEEWLYHLGLSTFEKVYNELKWMRVGYSFSGEERLALDRVIKELLANDQFKELMELVRWQLPRNVAEFVLMESAKIACKHEDPKLLEERTKEIIKKIAECNFYLTRALFWLGWENYKRGNVDILKEIILTVKIGQRDIVRQLHAHLVKSNYPSDLENSFPDYFKDKEPTRSDIEFYTIVGEYNLAIELANTHPDEKTRNELLRIIEVQRRPW